VLGVGSRWLKTTRGIETLGLCWAGFDSFVFDSTHLCSTYCACHCLDFQLAAMAYDEEVNLIRDDPCAIG